MKKSYIVFVLLALIAVVAIYLFLEKVDSDTVSDELLTNKPSVEMQTESGTRASDYNSSRSNRTTASGISSDGVDQDCDGPDCEVASTNSDGDSAPANTMDQDCTGRDCPALDADSDNDSVPNNDSASQAGYDGYLQIGDVKGESRDN